MKIPHDSVVLVADGAKMLFFRNEGDDQFLRLVVEDAEQQRDDYDRDIKSDAAGRMPRTTGGNAAVGEADFHRQAEDRFARAAAETLNRRALAGSFDALVVVAPPATLGELRKHYHKETAKRLTGELAKDLANQPVDRIEAALSGA
jgi:protein required for attachment to host cells